MPPRSVPRTATSDGRGGSTTADRRVRSVSHSVGCRSVDRTEALVTVCDGHVPVPEPFAGLVADAESERRTFWSRLLYQRWPLIVLSSKEPHSEHFEALTSTPVTSNGVPIPSRVTEATKLAQETDSETADTLDGTKLTLLTQAEMRTGDVTSVYVLTLGQAGALRNIYPMLPVLE